MGFGAGPKSMTIGPVGCPPVASYHRCGGPGAPRTGPSRYVRVRGPREDV